MKSLAVVILAVIASAAIAADIVNHAAVMRASRDSAFVVIDVRDSNSFRRGQVAGSVNVPCPGCYNYDFTVVGKRSVVLVGNKADRKVLDSLASNLEYSKIPTFIDDEPFETYPYPVVQSTSPFYVNVTGKVAFGGSPYPYIIDVREIDEFANGHAAGAYNIPLGHLRDRACEIDVTQRPHVICHSGFRSTKATVQLVGELGFTDLVNINDGTMNWPGPIDKSVLPNYTNVTREELKQVYAKSTVIDVRAEVDYKAGHIPLARNIPYAQLKARAGEVPDNSYVVCYSGRTSLAATKMLADKGKLGLKNLLRGMGGWDGPIEP